MRTFKIEWRNGWTNRGRVTTVKVSEPPQDWRQIIKDKAGMVSVLDVHVLAVREVTK